MIEIIRDEKFKRLFKKWGKRHPNLLPAFKKKLKLFMEDPYNPLLKTHSLSGKLEGLWAFSISFNQRLVFEFADKSRKKVFLVYIGTHDEVY